MGDWAQVVENTPRIKIIITMIMKWGGSISYWCNGILEFKSSKQQKKKKRFLRNIYDHQSWDIREIEAISI